MNIRSMVGMLLLATSCSTVFAQGAAWPTRPVRVVVPFAAGGSTDIVARILAARLSESFGQQFIIDNRAGAGGSVGSDITQRANPDGYTVIIVATSYSTNAAMYSMPFDPVKGITPIALLHSGPWVLAVNNIFISCSNQLGAVESGWTAAWLGAVPSVWLGGVATILIAAACAVVSPQLRRWRQD